MRCNTALLLCLLLAVGLLVGGCVADEHNHSLTVSVVHDDHDHEDHDGHDHEHEDKGNVVALKVTSIIVVPLASVIVVLFVIFAPWCRIGSRVLSLASSFSAGLFLIMALTHLLQDAVEELAAEEYSDKYSPAFVMCAAGYLFLVFLERGVFGGSGGHSHGTHDDHEEDTPAAATEPAASGTIEGGATPSSDGDNTVRVDIAEKPAETPKGADALVTVTLLALGVHSIFVGMSVGLQDSAEDVTVLLVAILCHQWAEDFSLAVATGKAGYSIPRRLLISGIENSACAAGIAIGWIIQSSLSSVTVAFLVAASAGTCLNLACTAIIPEEMPRDKKSWWALVAAFAGAALMYTVKILLHSMHSHEHNH